MARSFQQKSLNCFFTLLFTTLLAACGGGGGGTTTRTTGTVPAAPTGVAALAANTQVTISWDAVAGATSYKMYMAEAAGVSKSTPGAMHHPNISSPFVHTGLVNGTTYYFVVTAVNAAGESIESSEASATPNIPIIPVSAPLNDTGQTACYNDTVLADCAVVAIDTGTHPRQDARFGRDAILPVKTGAGAAGFDFTRVCMSGEKAGVGACTVDPNPAVNQADPTANEWACTQDNHTKLMWSLNTTSATWDSANTTITAAMNTANRCGYNTGWRLPTARELLSIVHFGAANPAIDTAYFPNTFIDDFYWSSNVYATGDSNYAQHFHFDKGRIADALLTSIDYVRLVRSVPPPLIGAP